MSYGTDSTSLMVWYDWEEIKEFFNLWTPPETPKWINLKTWSDSARTDKTPNTISYQQPAPLTQKSYLRGGHNGGYNNINERGRGSNLDYNREERYQGRQEERYQDNYNNYNKGERPDRNPREEIVYRQNHYNPQRREEDREFEWQNRRQDRRHYEHQENVRYREENRDNRDRRDYERNYHDSYRSES